MHMHLRFESAEQTTNFAERLSPCLTPGDVILLHGNLGAGKTHFARALIQSKMAEAGLREDVPSPTFTLVQTYEFPDVQIWHADLYRLNGIDDVFELGLYDAFETDVCLVEWPDRLGDECPKDALNLTFEMTQTPGERLVTAQSNDPSWTARLEQAVKHG